MGGEHSRKESQCKGPKVETDFVLSRGRRDSMAGAERARRNMTENEFEEVCGSHIIPCFEEFVFYFKYNGKLVEGVRRAFRLSFQE